MNLTRIALAGVMMMPRYAMVSREWRCLNAWGGHMIDKILCIDGLVMPQRTVRLYAIVASGRDAPSSMDELGWNRFALRCSHVRINEMPRHVSAYQGASMDVHESN